MNKKIKIITKEAIYKGYLQLYNYDLEIPSFDAEKEHIASKKREIVQTYDSVLVLVYAPMLDSLVMCREFRPGVFFNASQDDPFVFECVSGTIDSNKTPEETAKIEVYEEAGLRVDSLKLIAQAYKSPGILTEKMYIYYAEVNGAPKSGIHGVGDEEILTQIIPRKKIYDLMDEMKIVDGATLIALNWFRARQETAP
ncbi:ADP-ribose pyrophosphatase [Legionella massiliensis]|uniref:ADP-ribose pyrophosphatase n=1 Tax=Legionella massiliensis TaxID=1034943 RepID=A0A078KV48_9GAMM|nr:NUDIX domain-containing protein [Legionella massiliensis]CDZ76867.1 ADP-ribose pyrophosphatase [Legionella massiliensis]CEE12605.1 ADP-ribose pyrophosphatase [Legionella massiliensis]